MKEYPILFKRKEECSGCAACYSICSKNAINMIVDDEGFEYPEVNRDRCVKCYLCLKVCPFK